MSSFLGIRRTIRKRSTPHIVQRFDRKNGHYEDGIWIKEKEEKEYVSLHTQPKVNKLVDGMPGQVQTDEKHGWSIDLNKRLRNKDQVLIGDAWFTVSNLQDWTVYIEFDLTRSGETDNIEE